MAAEMRTVRVTGLPEHMSENRLSDKIHIHFLRKKNGGGEISSLTISKSTPGTAFITFEESEVALRLAKQGRHIFKVNDKSYDVMISLHHQKVDPDEVILHMSVIVDHSKLPEGRRTLFSFHKTFPDVHLIFDPKKDNCTLSGRYTEVQSLCDLVLISVDSQKQNSGDGLLSRAEMCGFPLEKKEKSPLGENEDAGVTKMTQQTKELDIAMENTVSKTGLPQLSSYIPQVSTEASMDDRWGLEPEDGTSFEDFSLVVDSDIFRYFNKHCTKEYQSILRRHRVEVLDMTCQDITTLYIKSQKSLSNRESISIVKTAHEELAHLYQMNGSQLRKENISKSGIPKDSLGNALESLKQRLPKMMVDEDEGNVYLVGSKSDVSEAKQFISDAKGIRMDKDAISDNLFPLSKATCTFSHQGGLGPSAPPEQSDIFQPLEGKFQPQDHQFDLWKDYPNPKEAIFSSKEITSMSDDHTHYRPFTSLAETKIKRDDELFSSRRNCDTSKERDFQSYSGGWNDRFTDSLFFSAKPPSAISPCDLDKRPLDNPDFISEDPKLTCHPDTSLNGEKQLKSSTGYKTKRAEREMKMAANFRKDLSSGISESDYKSGDTKYAVDQKTDLHKAEDMSINERKHPDSRQAHSLPFSKLAVNSNLKPNAMFGNTGAKGSVLNKMDMLPLKSDLKKPAHFSANSTEKKATKMPAYSIESQSFSLGHMDLCGDTGITKYPIIPSGSTRKRSNSFSGNVRTGLDEPKAVDLIAGQKERSQGSQTKEVFTVDVRVPLKVWIYLKSVYNTDIDNLTSDLQTKEKMNKDELTLCLRGADSEKVKESQRSLERLIATTEMDFDSRLLQLSTLGVSDCKDKALVDFCTEVKQVHKKVKIVIMSNTVMILGPKATCQQVEATMTEIFHAEDSGTKATVEGWKPHKPSPLEITTGPSTTNSDSKSFLVADRPTPTGAHIITKKDLPKMVDQSNDQVSKNVPKLLEDLPRDASLGVINKDKQEQDYRAGSYKNTERDQETEKRTQYLDYTVMPTVWKNTDLEGKSQLTGNFTDQENVGCSGDQIKDVIEQPGVLKVSSTRLPSYVNAPLSCVCGSQSSNVIQAACGTILCSQCQKEAHANCKLCPPETNQDSWGIKGTMSIRESTITIPGFIRDPALKIVYEIPDGIQGEGHPCPGAPFKGSKFEAFLPLNGDTKRLVPLLKKAFHKGLTFTVKDGPEGAQVVWGCIPHKIRLEGGASRNGYPDSNYIRRLAEALKAAGLEE